MGVSRLKCGWNTFYQTLSKFNAGKVVPTDLKDEKTATKYKYMVSDETEFITGQGGLDVDIKVEETIFKRIRQRESEHKYYKFHKDTFGADSKKNWNTITYTPKLITIEFHTKFNIQFLDFNSAILQCARATEAEYKKCAGYIANKLE